MVSYLFSHIVQPTVQPHCCEPRLASLDHPSEPARTEVGPVSNQVVQVPVSLLLDPDQNHSTKVIWMALRLNPTARPEEMEALTGLSRHTVLSGLVRAADWNPSRSGPRVKVPGALMAEPAVGAPAKVLYGLLQATPNFRGYEGEFTYGSLSVLTRCGPNTLKRAVADLVGAGWLQISQKSRLSPIKFTLGSPERARALAEADLARKRLKRGDYGGEAIMQEYLSLLIDSNQFTDNARPGFLINPQTGERLELDRFYSSNVAFEFNGAQHYRKTGRYTKEQAEAQHFRDLIKAGLSLYEGIHLIIVHPEDLSLQRMIRKVGNCMPLKSLAGQEPLIDLLEEASIPYVAAAETARKAGN
jgi:hypothetical protein